MIFTLFFNRAKAQELVADSVHTKETPQTLSATKKTFVLNIDMENGGILGSSKTKANIYENAYYNGLNIRLGWKSKTPTKDYDLLYNNPIYGIGFYSSTFNTPVIGKPYALYGFFQAPFLTERKNKIEFDYRIGLGLSGNFNPYHDEKNPINLLIGSKNNVFIDFGIQGQYPLTSHLKGGIGLSFHHFSNGALQMPNKGVNLIPVTLSLTYQPTSGVTHSTPTAEISPFPTQWDIHFSYAFGFKQFRVEDNSHHFKSTFNMYASRYIHHKWQLGGGFDLFYSDTGNKKNFAGKKQGKMTSQFSGGPSLYFTHVLNPKLLLTGNIGYYLHKQKFNGELTRIFLRAGFRHSMYKNLYAGTSIKAHMGKADYIEWTIGYTFSQKSKQ